MLILCQLLHVLYTLYIIFYTFSETNLLTSCHSASSCFLLFVYSRKASLEIFSELDENLRRPLFYQKTPGVQRGDEEEPRGPHTWARRGQGGTRAEGWCGHLVHRLATPFRDFVVGAIYRGTEVSVLAPCRDGELPPEPSPSTPPPPSCSVSSSPMDYGF